MSLTGEGGTSPLAPIVHQRQQLERVICDPDEWNSQLNVAMGVPKIAMVLSRIAIQSRGLEYFRETLLPKFPALQKVITV